MSKENSSKKNLENSRIDSSNILFSNIAATLVGQQQNEIKLSGTQDEITAVTSAIEATRTFHEHLNDADANLSTVVELLYKKHDAAAKFEQVLGIPWIL